MEYRHDKVDIPCLYNANLCIIGPGHIGMEVAKRAKYGFNMNVSGVRNNLKKKTPEGLFTKMYHFNDL